MMMEEIQLMEEKKRQCIKCLKWEPASDFSSSSFKGLEKYCYPCRRRYLEYARASKHYYWRNSAHGFILRHKRKGFKVLVEWILLEEYLYEHASMKTCCSICDKSLNWEPWNRETKKQGPNHDSPTIDVKDPHDNLLTLDKLQIVCSFCNRVKSNQSMPEFIKYCRYISETHSEVM